MELLKTWILGVTGAAVVLAAADALMPEGTVKTVGKITGGLILALALLNPLVRADYETLFQKVSHLPDGRICREDLEEETYHTMKQVIEQKLAAYIVDKGTELGAVCAASVVCQPGEGGVPVPQTAAITGTLTSEQQKALSECITQDLGLSPEQQHYQNREEEAS